MVATGPSLSEVQRDLVVDARSRGVVKVFGINDAYRMFGEELDYLYACDPTWWDRHIDRVRNLPCERWTQCEDSVAKYKPALNYVKGTHKGCFSTQPGLIHYGHNSGYQAMNLAYLMGFKNQILIGYNMRHSPEGKAHFFGDHPPGLSRASTYKQFLASYATINVERLGMRVINCTPQTALECFDRMELQDALALALQG